MTNLIQFKNVKLSYCPKCNSKKLSIRYRQGKSKMKTPYFYGSVKCKKCRYFVKSTNPQKLITEFNGKLIND